MKVQKKIDLWMIAAGLPVLFILIVFFLGMMKEAHPSYTIFNKSYKGISIFYETMQRLNYPIKVGHNPVEKMDTKDIQIVIEPMWRYEQTPHYSNMIQWAKQGGKLIVLTNNQQVFDTEITENEMESTDSFSVYPVGKGVILLGTPEMVTNETLLESNEDAYQILQHMDNVTYRNIYFNEYYHGYGFEQQSLWKDMPLSVKMIIYQGCIVILFILFYKGRRFGRVEPYFEEVERSENEFLKAVSSLYREAGFWEVIGQNYYMNLLVEMEKTFGVTKEVRDKDWINLWKQYDLPSEQKAKEVFRFMNEEIIIKNKKQKAKQFAYYIHRMEQLKKILRKRRESLWKGSMQDIQKRSLKK
jgi:hypothetical protein